MPTITEVKKDRIFYRNFGSLVEVLKSIAGSQFQAAEKKIKLFPELTGALEEFIRLPGLESLKHPMVTPGDLPMGIVVVTSDSGLMGGVNYKLMTRAMNYAREKSGRLIVVGMQGQKFTMRTDFVVTKFPGVLDNECFRQAQDLTAYLLKEVADGKLGAVKILFPYAASIGSQHIVEWDFFPCTAWSQARLPGQKDAPAADTAAAMTENRAKIIMESETKDVVEYVAGLWIRQKLYEIFQFSRVAEYAARIVHLEDSTHRVKEIEHKLKLKYFRLHHSVIDQQMRELFAGRSIYA